MLKKRVVIVGMGFGGLTASHHLAASGFEVIMVDTHNYHLFQPLLYQVATAGLEQESIAYPVRALARNWDGAEFRLGTVIAVEPENKKVILQDGSIEYDYLILATGSKTNFFGMKSVEENSFELKTLQHAENLRNHILLLFEKASRENNLEKRKELLTFVIVGGGPTGVEFSGALRELSRHVLSRDYPNIDVNETRIILVEAGDSLLTAMEPHLREYAANKLRSMGVEIQLLTQVVEASDDMVTFKDGTYIKTHTLLWSAGVAAAELASALGFKQGGGGRLIVAEDLSIPDYSEIFAIGDTAFVIQDGKPLPMIAPVASQSGRYVADVIKKHELGEVVKPFHYRDKGSMATIGRSAAVASTNGYSFSGFIAWVVWLMLHLYYLIGFRNRILVLMNWAFYYFFHERQVRLITGDLHKKI